MTLACTRPGARRCNGWDCSAMREWFRRWSYSRAAALSFIDNGVGVPPLIDPARNGAPRTRSSAVFWLGQTRDPRAFVALHSIIENSNELEGVRANAIFSLANGEETPPSEYAYLRALFPRLTSKRPSLKEHALFVLSQRKDDAATDELMRIAQSDSDKQMRSKAMFWLGQKDDPRVTKMIGDRILR